MSNCRFCGEPAGFLRSKHTECEAKYNAGWAEMVETARRALTAGTTDEVLNRLAELAKTHRVPPDLVRGALVAAWTAEVESTLLKDQLVTDEEETKLVAFQGAFDLTQAELDRTGLYLRLGRAAILRDVMNGKIPEGLHMTGQVPFNFQKSEAVIWCFNNVEYFETRARTEYVGRSAGVSIRIASGLYYRTGAFHGQPIQTSQVVHVGTGPLAVTNKHLYFAGGSTSLRIPYSKIVSFQPYSDGIGIQRDGAAAKPQVFRTDDGWFAYNLIVNAARL